MRAATSAFTVTLSQAVSQAVTVDWEATIESGDTAVLADLGTTREGTVTIAGGDTTGTFDVATVDDATEEEGETFTVTLSDPSNATLDPNATTATGTILANDDTTAPSLVSADIVAAVLTLTYDEELDEGSVPAKSQPT